MSVTARLDALQRRVPALSFPLAVVYKFVDDQGGYLAALITYYGFLAFFPLLLLLSSVLGFALGRDPDLQQRVVDSTLSQFPVIGSQLSSPEGLHGSAHRGRRRSRSPACTAGIGVAQAVQNAMNTAWSVARNERPNPFLGRLLSLGLLAIGGLAIVTTTAADRPRHPLPDRRNPPRPRRPGR